MNLALQWVLLGCLLVFLSNFITHLKNLNFNSWLLKGQNDCYLHLPLSDLISLPFWSYYLKSKQGIPLCSAQVELHISTALFTAAHPGSHHTLWTARVLWKQRKVHWIHVNVQMALQDLVLRETWGLCSFVKPLTKITTWERQKQQHPDLGQEVHPYSQC